MASLFVSRLLCLFIYTEVTSDVKAALWAGKMVQECQTYYTVKI